MKNKINSLPENDPKERFLLGLKGKNNLMVIGLNPSTQSLNCNVGPAKNIVLKPLEVKPYMKRIRPFNFRDTIS